MFAASHDAMAAISAEAGIGGAVAQTTVPNRVGRKQIVQNFEDDMALQEDIEKQIVQNFEGDMALQEDINDALSQEIGDGGDFDALRSGVQTRQTARAASQKAVPAKSQTLRVTSLSTGMAVEEDIDAFLDAMEEDVQ